MKKTLTVAILAIAPCLMSCAQTSDTQQKPQSLYELTQGHVTMKIDASRGGRITSLCYDGMEVLSQIPVPNMFGSTFWTSPQKEWNWPPVKEHDILPYEVQEQDGTLTMRSQLSAKLPMRITKKFVTDDADGAIVITYSVTNESDSDRKVAPWEITRVPSEGVITFDAPLNSITPAGLMPFVEKDNLAYYEIDHVEGQNRKINADGKGWLSYVNNGLKLTKRFPDLTPEQPAPGEAEIQVYVHQGKAYVEIESQGEYTLLHPGESLDWTVRWYLQPAE